MSMTVKFLDSNRVNVMNEYHNKLSNGRKCKASDDEADSTSRANAGKHSITPSTAELNRIVGYSPAPRMLTPYEIRLLRRSAREIAEVVREILSMTDEAKRSSPEDTD